MDYRQYRRMRKLVHECCNYDNGNCIALDNGEECVCVQSISYSLLCKWFRSAVLPLDKSLETVLLFRDELKRCSVCGQPFRPGSNRAKYCKSCATKVHRRQKTDSDRKGWFSACLSNLYPSFLLDIPHSSFPCCPCRGRRRTSHSPGTACRSCSVCRNSSFCWNCICGGLQNLRRRK